MNKPTNVVIINHKLQALLPRVGALSTDIPPDRFGRAVTKALREQLDIDTFLIVSQERMAAPVLRLQHENTPLPEGCRWCDLDEAFHTLPIEHQAATRRVIFQQFVNESLGSYVWYDTAMRLVCQHFETAQQRLQRVQQWHGDRESVVLRLDTMDGQTLWLKAVDAHSKEEVKITRRLVDRHPALMPKVIASWHDPRMMLIEHLDGIELAECDDLGQWVAVARLLAEMQMQWVGAVDPLIAAGAPNMGPDRLAQMAGIFCDFMVELMANQPNPAPVRLGRQDLVILREALEDACTKALELPFSIALANADFSPHNVILTQRGPAFFDWSEAVAGFPFITGEYLWNRMITEVPERKHWEGPLRSAYREMWERQYGAHAVQSALELAQLLAPYSVALYLGGWQCTDGADLDGRYLRSLTRRMYRIAATQQHLVAMS